MTNSHMVLFLLFVLVIALIITFAILAGKKHRESYKTWGGPMKKIVQLAVAILTGI